MHPIVQFMFTLLWSVPCTQVVEVEHDILGYFYVATTTKIVKLNKNCDTIAIYNAPKRKKITHIDTSNPLNVLVFFDEIDKLLWLDKSMNETYSLTAMQLGLFAIQAAGRSRDDGLWVFDNLQQQIDKINYEERHITKKYDLKTHADAPFQFVELKEYNCDLYALDTTKGLYLIDAFGNIKKRLPLLHTYDWQLLNNKLLHTTTAGWLSYDPLTLTTNAVSSNLPPFTTFSYSHIDNLLITADSTHIKLWSKQ